MSRDPERTRERILSAALAEFSAKGFAGARVDEIAERAQVNKRMLYHYFGDKEGLFREILERKIAEKQAVLASAPDDPVERTAHYYEMACHDADWIRLLEWEALQSDGGRVLAEEERTAGYETAMADLRERQQRGEIDPDLDIEQLFLTMMALTSFPMAFPQTTRLVTGYLPTDPEFQKARGEFLRRLAAKLFRP